MPQKTENKTLKSKIRILEKTIEAGLKSEKDYTNLSAQDFYKLQSKCKMNRSDVALFFELSEAIRTNRLITYLSEVEKDDSGGGEKVEAGTQSGEALN